MIDEQKIRKFIGDDVPGIFKNAEPKFRRVYDMVWVSQQYVSWGEKTAFNNLEKEYPNATMMYITMNNEAYYRIVVEFKTEDDEFEFIMREHLI